MSVMSMYGVWLPRVPCGWRCGKVEKAAHLRAYKPKNREKIGRRD